MITTQHNSLLTCKFIAKLAFHFLHSEVESCQLLQSNSFHVKVTTNH